MIRVCWSGCAPQIVPLTILFFFLINWTQPRVSPQNVVFLPSIHPQQHGDVFQTQNEDAAFPRGAAPPRPLIASLD